MIFCLFAYFGFRRQFWDYRQVARGAPDNVEYLVFEVRFLGLEHPASRMHVVNNFVGPRMQMGA
jgi:hypothetical protein